MNANKKFIVWDWNGTLLDDTHVSHNAVNGILQHYKKPPLSFERFQDVFDMPLIKLFSNIGLPESQIAENAESMMEVFHSTYYGQAAEPKLREGLKNTPPLSPTRAFTNIILSNHLTQAIDDYLCRLNARQAFDHILANADTAEQVRKISKGERLRRHMETHGLSADDTVIIGDTPEEAHIGHELGIASVLITGGYASPSRLQKAQPDYLIHSFDELPTILQQRGFYA